MSLNPRKVAVNAAKADAGADRPSCQNKKVTVLSVAVAALGLAMLGLNGLAPAHSSARADCPRHAVGVTLTHQGQARHTPPAQLCGPGQYIVMLTAFL
jgi:hypothetical protein